VNGLDVERLVLPFEEQRHHLGEVGIVVDVEQARRPDGHGLQGLSAADKSIAADVGS
jgi:hypothetical protein